MAPGLVVSFQKTKPESFHRRIVLMTTAVVIMSTNTTTPTTTDMGMDMIIIMGTNITTATTAMNISSPVRPLVSGSWPVSEPGLAKF